MSFFLLGCSSPKEVAQPRPMVEVDGIGSVLKSFTANLDRFDVDVINNTNRHNEKNVTTDCSTSGFWSWFDESFGRDTTAITGEQVGDKDYKLTVRIDSESGTLMWNGDVTTTFLYNGTTHTWSMSSKIYDKHDYHYCQPAAVAETLLASLQCYVSNYSASEEGKTISSLLTSLNAQRAKIVETSGKLYSATDCEMTVDPQQYQVETTPMGF